MTTPVDAAEIANGFSERDFYLAEFRGRTLAFALPAATPEELALFEAVLADLEANRTRVIVFSTDGSASPSFSNGSAP